MSNSYRGSPKLGPREIYPENIFPIAALLSANLKPSPRNVGKDDFSDSLWSRQNLS